jgi:hypothetical protein
MVEPVAFAADRWYDYSIAHSGELAVIPFAPGERRIGRPGLSCETFPPNAEPGARVVLEDERVRMSVDDRALSTTLGFVLRRFVLRREEER